MSSRSPASALIFYSLLALYRRNRVETFVSAVLYDLFIAPVLSAMVTLALFSVHSLVLITTAFAAFRLTIFYTTSTLAIDDYDLEIYYAIGCSSTSVAILSFFLPSDGSPMLSVLCTLTTAIFGIGAFKLNSMPVDGIGLMAGIGAVIGAVLYWTVLDTEKKAISGVLAKSYAQNSSMKLRPKDLKVRSH
uniref:EamA domain-containing protein n=1 Tax=Steinernema glaseri TaxID=37863 RepID=A0A1I7YSE9_9BILA